MPSLTVFTPAYNRAHTLGRTYQSLLSQSCKDFVWLIVDDGSTDGTAELVREWQARENGFEIEYVYKENGGMHTAHNTAYEHIRTELNICIDSDDMLAEEAAQRILSFWNEHGGERYAGVVGLDATFNGTVIGKDLGEARETTLSGYYARGGRGDKKLVYRTELMKKYPPYPVFEGEKYFSLGYKYLLCDQEYPLLVLNEVLCNVEYQPDGSSRNMFRQYRSNPRGFALLRKVNMQYQTKPAELFKTCVHYVSSSLLARNRRFVSESPRKALTLLAVPFGWLLAQYIKRRAKAPNQLKGYRP